MHFPQLCELRGGFQFSRWGLYAVMQMLYSFSLGHFCYILTKFEFLVWCSSEKQSQRELRLSSLYENEENEEGCFPIQELLRTFQNCIYLYSWGNVEWKAGGGGYLAIYFPLGPPTKLAIQVHHKNCLLELEEAAEKHLPASSPFSPRAPAHSSGEADGPPPPLLVPSAVPQSPPTLRWHLHQHFIDQAALHASQQVQTLSTFSLLPRPHLTFVQLQNSPGTPRFNC